MTAPAVTPAAAAVTPERDAFEVDLARRIRRCVHAHDLAGADRLAAQVTREIAAQFAKEQP